MQPRHEFHDVTRRYFLKSALVAAGACIAGPVLGSVVPAADGLVFKGSDMIALEAIAETIVPQGGPYERGAKDAHLAARIDQFMFAGDPAVAQGMVGAVRFVEQQLPLLLKRQGPFSATSAAQREVMFKALLDMPGQPRQIFIGLRNVCLLAFYTDDPSWSEIGYDGPLV